MSYTKTRMTKEEKEANAESAREIQAEIDRDNQVDEEVTSFVRTKGEKIQFNADTERYETYDSDKEDEDETNVDLNENFEDIETMSFSSYNNFMNRFDATLH